MKNVKKTRVPLPIRLIISIPMILIASFFYLFFAGLYFIVLPLGEVTGQEEMSNMKEILSGIGLFIKDGVIK